MKQGEFDIPVIGFSAYSGTGKTTLLLSLIPLLRDKGVRLAVLKHAHHNFDTDQPGKDSYELRKAGAQQMLVSSSRRTAIVIERESESEPTLRELLSMLDTRCLDLVLVEGFKAESFPKIELHRSGINRPLSCTHDANIVAVASDENLPEINHVPVLNLNDVDEIADFILENVAIPKAKLFSVP